MNCKHRKHPGRYHSTTESDTIMVAMANLTVKDIPEDVYSQLKAEARSEGRSLNRYIVALLKASTEERDRRKMMRQGRAEFRAFLASLPKMEDSTPLIREDRDRGH